MPPRTSATRGLALRPRRYLSYLLAFLVLVWLPISLYIVLSLPYFSGTLYGAYTFLYIIRVLESRPCMYRRIRLYTEQNMQEEVGAWRMPFVLSCVLWAGGQGSWLLNLPPIQGVSFGGVLWSIADFLGPSIWLLESAAL
jgi:hypothetical protein